MSLTYLLGALRSLPTPGPSPSLAAVHPADLSGFRSARPAEDASAPERATVVLPQLGRVRAKVRPGLSNLN